MLVKYWMKRDFAVVEAKDPVKKAVKLLTEHRARFLPVVDKGKLVGVITEGDVKKALGLNSPFKHVDVWLVGDSTLTVGEVMNPDPLTVSPETTMEDVVKVLFEHKRPGAPVVDEEGRVLGTITQADLYRALIAMCGFMEKGIQFAFEIDDRAGSLKELTDVIRDYGGRISSILTSFDTAPAGFRHAYIRIFGIKPHKVAELEKALSGKAKLIHDSRTTV